MLLTKQKLKRYYQTKKYSLRKIGKIFKCDCATILRYMKIYEIPRRSISETNHLRTFSEKTKNKMSKKAKTRFKNPKNNPMYGRKHSKNSLDLMIKNHPRISGKNHFKYNPTLSKKDRISRRCLTQYTDWSKYILKNGKYTCTICKDSKGGNLEAHHLEGYHWCKQLRFEISNGICLCNKCHKLFHKKFGNVFNTTEQFVEFIYGRIY